MSKIPISRTTRKISFVLSFMISSNWVFSSKSLEKEEERNTFRIEESIERKKKAVRDYNTVALCWGVDALLDVGSNGHVVAVSATMTLQLKIICYIAVFNSTKK